MILILYLIIAYFTMFIFSTFMVGTTHKPDLSTKASGEKEVIVATNDGWGYGITPYIKLADVNKGEIYYDSENPTCVIIDAA